jgi:hypothetical protein
MDPNRFDTLARSLTATSRRRILGLQSSSAVGVLTLLLQRADVEAGKRKKKKKKSATLQSRQRHQPFARASRMAHPAASAAAARAGRVRLTWRRTTRHVAVTAQGAA